MNLILPMRPKESNSSPESVRRPARDMIDAVLENMRRNLEPLKYSVLAPSRYLVYLHPAEYVRLEGIIGILQEQTIRALSEEVDTLNRRSILRNTRNASSATERLALRIRVASGPSSFFRTRMAISPRATSWLIQSYCCPQVLNWVLVSTLVSSRLFIPVSRRQPGNGPSRGTPATIKCTSLREDPIRRCSWSSFL